MRPILAETPATIGGSLPPYPLRLRDLHRPDWQIALTEAEQRRLVVERRQSTTVCGIVMTGYAVSSPADPDSCCGVAVSRDWEGDIYTICDCPAGHELRPCVHTALAVEHAGLWPWPMARQTAFAG